MGRITPKGDFLTIEALDQKNKFEVPGPDDLGEADETGIPYADLCDPRSKYTPQQKANAVAAMCLWGDSITAADKTGINAATIRWWKTEATWWPALEQKFRKTKNEELIGGYTRAIDTLMEHVHDAAKGEPIFDKKTGEIIGYKKPSLRDLVMAIAIMQDKRAVLLGEPTSISSKTAAEQLAEAYKIFLEQGEELRKKKEPKVIQGERLQ